MEKNTTRELLNWIYQADADELNEILSAATERFRELWPAWDLLTISCEGHTPEDHIRTLEQAVRLMSVAAKDFCV